MTTPPPLPSESSVPPLPVGPPPLGPPSVAPPSAPLTPTAITPPAIPSTKGPANLPPAIVPSASLAKAVEPEAPRASGSPVVPGTPGVSAAPAAARSVAGPPSSGAGYKAATAVLLVLLLGVSGGAGYYIYMLRTRLASGSPATAPANATAEVAGLREEVSSARTAAKLAEAQVEEKSRRIGELEAAARASGNGGDSLASANARVAELETSVRTLEKRETESKGSMAGLRQAILQAQTDAQTARDAAKAAAAAEISQASEAAQVAAKRADAASAELARAREEVETLRGKLAKATAAPAVDAAGEAKLREQLDAATKSLSELRGAAEKSRGEVASLREKLAKATAASSGGAVADDSKLVQLIKDNRRRFSASGQISKVTLTPNVTVDDQAGVQVKVSFTVKGMKDLRGLLAAWVVDDVGNFVPAAADGPASNRDGGGNIVSMSRFTPTLENANFAEETLFIPYAAFGKPAGGSASAKIRVQLFSGDMGADEAQYRLARDESQQIKIGGK